MDRSGSSQMLVLLRLEARAPERLRTFSSDCTLDAGGLPVFWLSEVRPSEGVALLETFVGNSSLAGKKVVSAIENAIRDDPETEVKTKAVFALTQMPKDEGIPLLIEVARTNRNPEVRRKAVFWLGQSRDPRALDFIEEILK